MEPRLSPSAQQIERAEQAQVYDHQVTLTAVGGSEATAQMLLEKFITLLPQAVQEIHAAHSANDQSGLYDAIHKLAGSTSIVGAVAIHAEAKRVQNLLKQRPLLPEQINDGVVTILDEIACFQQQFST